MDMRTDRLKIWRGRATMPALFIASFAATYFLTRPTAAMLSPPDFEAGMVARGPSAGSTPPADVPESPSPPAAWEPAEPGPEPTPSLQDLATDNDPATRDEALALLGLLDQEQLP
jgi:hypothetical protein